MEIFAKNLLTILNHYKLLLTVIHHGCLMCLKSVRIWSHSGPFFPAFGLNTGRYSVSLRVQSEWGEMWTRMAPNASTCYAVLMISFFSLGSQVLLVRSDHQMCSIKKLFVKISQNQRETCERVSFLIKLQASDLLKRRL